jgi:ferrous-iron efflux pump FieF
MKHIRPHRLALGPLQAAGVGVVVTLIALVSTLALVTFQRWVVRKTQIITSD